MTPQDNQVWAMRDLQMGGGSDVSAAFTAQQKLDEVEREIRFRRRNHERRAAIGLPRLRDKQLAVFEAIAEDYRAAREQQP